MSNNKVRIRKKETVTLFILLAVTLMLGLLCQITALYYTS